MTAMFWLTRLFENPASQKERKPQLPFGTIKADDPRIDEGRWLVYTHWSSVGRVDEEVVGYDPDLKAAGTPVWPSGRQEYHAVHIDDGLIIVTDGLSDPFVGTDCDDSSGWGLEFYIEKVSQNSESYLDQDELPEMEVLEQVAYNAIEHGGFRELIDELGVLSITVPMGCQLGERWEDTDGLIGLLLWVPLKRRNWQLALPFGEVRFVAVTPLLPQELSYAAQSAANRNALADALNQSREGHRFDPHRSVLSLVAMS
jgi:hypothetical protein